MLWVYFATYIEYMINSLLDKTASIGIDLHRKYIEKLWIILVSFNRIHESIS